MDTKLKFLNHIDPVARYEIQTTTSKISNVSIQNNELQNGFLSVEKDQHTIHININHIVAISKTC